MPGKGKGRAFFAAESDEDSVATDSTAESELLEEYGVERVLAENQDDNGNKLYLIKWEGYPLGRSTWEPADNILDPLIIEQWEEEKRKIDQNLAEPLEFDEWAAAVEELDKAKEDRRRRRKAKRRRRGIAVSPESIDNEDDEDEDGPNGPLFVEKRARPEDDVSSRTRKRVKQPEVQRKGVAQKVKSNRRTTRVASSSSSEGTLTSAKSSGGDSLLEELIESNKSSKETRSTRKSPRNRKDLSSEEENEDEPLALKKSRPKKGSQADVAPAQVAPAKPATRAPSTQAASTAPSKAVPAAAPSKSAPTTATSSAPKAKRTRQPDRILGNWDADKSRKERQRVSGTTPRDWTEPKFHNLSRQHKFQQYSRNERAPDPNALNMIDLKTGKAKATATDGNAQSAHSRRSPSLETRPEQPPPREALPQRSRPEPVRAGPDEAANEPAPLGRAPPTQIPVPTPYDFRKLETCKYWLSGDCLYTNETCRYAHKFPPPTGKDLTCWYWKKRGYCNKRDEDCRYAHRETGYDAPPPPSQYTSSVNEMPAPRANSPVERPPTSAKPSDVLDGPKTKKDVTCFYWHRGKKGCNKPEHVCEYVHRDTGHYAPKPQEFLPPLEIPATPPKAASPEAPTPRPLGQRDAPPSFASSLDIPKKEQTCYFWRTQGKCGKPDHVCEFAHRDTGHYAGPPGSFRGARMASGISPANAVPVANRDAVAPQSARSPEPPAADRRDGWMQQTVTQNKCTFQGSPMRMTDSPVHISDFSSPREHAPQTPQWNIMGAAMNRHASAPHFSMKATLVLSLQEESESEHINVKLDIPDTAAFKKFAGSDPFLRIDQMVTASDFEHLVWNDIIRKTVCSSGGIFVDDTQGASIDNITDVCKTHVAGLIARPEGHQSTMLIYPGNAEEWRFLDQGRKLSPGCVAHFRFFTELPNAPANERMSQVATVDQRPAAQILVEDLVHLDHKIFFAVKGKDAKESKEQKKPTTRAVFLIMPPTHQAELEVFVKYFTALDCKVYHSGQPGAWDYIRTKYNGSCTFIVHPDVQLWRIPGLYEVLLKRSGAQMFSIGVNRTVALLEDREPEFGCERLFPHGRVIYITDDTFINEPETANGILEAFINEHKKKRQGGENNRIAARPGIIEWLLNLAVSKTSVRGRKDSRWMDLYMNMSKLARLDLEDEDADDIEQAEKAPLYLVTLSSELLPELEAMEDPEPAMDLAVDWFAGWSLLHASRFRRFVICHGPASMNGEVNGVDGTSEEDPRGWAKKYQHMGVMPPKKALAMIDPSAKK